MRFRLWCVRCLVSNVLIYGALALPFTPPLTQFLNTQSVTNSCDKRMGNLKSALIARTALSYPYLKENSFIQ